MESIRKLLRSNPYFSGVMESELDQIAGFMREEHLVKDDIVFLEGETGEGLYFVLSGQIKLFKTSAGGREQVFRLVGPGGSFNEIPVFDGGPNVVGAQAMEPSTILILPHKDVAKLAQRYPAFALNVAKIFASRLRHVVGLVEDLSFRHVTGRVAHLLLSQMAETRQKPPASIAYSQQEIAAMVGTAREVVGRALKTLENARAIRIERQSIEVLDAQLLERWL